MINGWSLGRLFQWTLFEAVGVSATAGAVFG
jgi:hypothetical protein